MNRPDGKVLIAPERTFERTRGCWSCLGYENGELSRKHWDTCKARDLQVLDQTGEAGIRLPRLSNEEYEQLSQSGDARFQMMDRMITAGTAGLCMRGKAKTDFIHHQFLCDGWNARDGASVATAGRPLDKLPDELREIADGRAKKA